MAGQSQVRNVLQLEHDDSAARADGACDLCFWLILQSIPCAICSLLDLHPCPSCTRVQMLQPQIWCFLSVPYVTTSAQSHKMGIDVHTGKKMPSEVMSQKNVSTESWRFSSLQNEAS